jgi:hypothetical protein
VAAATASDNLANHMIPAVSSSGDTNIALKVIRCPFTVYLIYTLLLKPFFIL